MKLVKFYLLFLLSLFVLNLNAQVTQNFESGNRGAQAANCWSFPGTSFLGGSNAITGTFGGRTGQLSNANTTNGVQSPYIDMSTGNITFKHKLTSYNGSWKKLEVKAFSYSTSTTSTLYTFNYNSSNATTVQNASISVSLSGIYKIYFEFSGSGGNSRGMIDDISIPGTYKSDPSNNCQPIITPPDADGDGVADANDDYPNDSTRAYDNFLVSNYSTLMFEDLWPYLGDYDFNDMVIDYKINRVTNADNDVVELKGDFVLRATGASFNSGFGFQFDNLANNKIASVSGNEISSGSIHSFSSNGVEANQSYATIIVFDKAYNILQYPGSGLGINTDPSASSVSLDTINLVISFNSGVSLSDLTMAKFNPFMIVNQTRGREIHLPDKAPTSLVTTSLLGSGDDNSNAAQSRYYKTTNNLPWALNVISSIPYPKEKQEFSQCFKKFNTWVTTNGTNYADWYMNKNGYREANKMY
jgi:LruC domain-containing protein